MVTPKVTKPVPRSVAPRHRGHSLAPEHLGERGAAAALISAIGGMAIFIAAVAMTVGGLTLSSGYTGTTPPPNLAELSLSQVLGGIALLVLGLVIMATTLALLADLPRSRPLAIAACAIATVLAAAAFVVVMGPVQRDLNLLVALGVASVAFGGATVVLARLRR